MSTLRASRQRETQRRLMEAAERLFVEQGFDRVSLDRLATEAGFTRGAFHVNFTDKGALLMQLVEGVYEEHIQKIEQIDPQQPVQAWFRTFPRIGAWFALTLEAWRHAQHHEPTKERLRQCSQRLQLALADFLDRAAAAHGISLPMPNGELAGALIALRTGLLLQRGIGATVPQRTFARSAARLLGFGS